MRRPVVVSHGQTAFSVFICGGGKKGLVWFTHAPRKVTIEYVIVAQGYGRVRLLFGL